MQVKGNARQLKDQFINGINGDVMTAEIIKGQFAINDTAKVKVNKSLHGS